MNFIKVVDRYINGDFGNGLCILNDATDIKIHQEINGLNSLTFSIPSNSSKISYVLDGKYWYGIDGELYFPIDVDGDDNSHLYKVTCRHITGLMSIDNIIPDFPIMVGVTPYEILEKGIELCGSDYWGIIPQSELPNGIEWVDDLTDIVDGYEKTNLYQLIGNVIELEGYGELYFNKNRVAIVKRLGRDTDLFWSPKRNVERIRKGMNLNDIKNSLLVLGANDMPLNPTEYPGSIIESEESIKLYGKKVAVLNFPDILDQEELKTKALYQISEKNPDRIDKPKISIDVNAYELDNKNVKLGDGVRIISNELNIDEIKRIVEIDYYPFQISKSKYVIGDRALTLEEMLARQEEFVNAYSKNIDETGEIKVSAVQQITPALQSWKNFVFNSSFEVYSNDDKPKYWDCTEGAKVSRNSQNWGSASLMLTNGEKAIQSESVKIDTSWYSTESNGTIICFSHKWGSIKVRILDNDGNPIPHTSRFNSEKVTETIIPYDVYYREFVNLRFLHSDIQSTVKAYRIEFTGNDANQEAYIDNVMASPDNNGIIPIYRDGPESISYSQIGSDTGSGEGGGGVPDAEALFDNIEYMENDDTIECDENNETDILTVRVKRKPIMDNESFVNLTVLYTLNLDIKKSADVEATKRELRTLKFSLKQDGETIKESNKLYDIAAETVSMVDIITYQITIRVPTSSIKENTGSVFNVSVLGKCSILPESSISVIVTKYVESRQLLAEFPELREVKSGVLDNGINGKIYLEPNNKISFEIYCDNKGHMPTYTSKLLPWNSNKEYEDLFKTVQILRIFGSGENRIDNFSRYFQSHEALESVYGLENISFDSFSNSSFESAFSNCKKLRHAYGDVKVYRVSNLFNGCELLENAPSFKFNKNTTSNVYFSGTFEGCKKIKEIKINSLYTNNKGEISRTTFWSIQNAFKDCQALKKIYGDVIFEPTSAQNGNCVSAFENCINLEAVNMGGETGYNASGDYIDEEGWGYRDSIYMSEASRPATYPEKITNAFSNCSAEIISGSAESKKMLEATRNIQNS